MLTYGARVPIFRFPADNTTTIPPETNPPQYETADYEEEEYEDNDDIYDTTTTTTEKSDCGSDATYSVNPANYPQDQLQARVANWQKMTGYILGSSDF
jgi:hypothetical protein